jgi:hypothetical protein
VPERLRPVPKGHWTLAGGANHRCITNINPSPGPGRRKSRDYIASPLPGLVVSCVRIRWFAPPANVRDASGVHYAVAVLRFRPEKPGTFVTVSTCTKRLASSSSDNGPAPKAFGAGPLSGSTDARQESAHRAVKGRIATACKHRRTPVQTPPIGTRVLTLPERQERAFATTRGQDRSKRMRGRAGPC